MSFINSFWFALKNFTDNFNRTTSGSLGTSSGGQVWTALRGTWSANGSQGTSSDNAANYPIASYDIGTPNTSSRLDTSPGTGVAFWITDANSWWAAFPYYDSSTTTTCNAGQVSSGSNPPSGSCCSSVTSSTTSSCNAGYVTSANYINNCCDGGPFYQPATSGTCSSGLVTNTSNPPSGSCCSSVTTNPGTPGSSYDPTIVTSGGGYCCSASGYAKTSAERTSGYQGCPVYFPGCPCVETYTHSYACCLPGTTNSPTTASSCYFETTTTYTCPSGGTYNSSTGKCEIAGTATTYSCYTTLSGGTAAYYYCNTSTTSSTTYSCYTSTTSSTTYSSAIRVISSVSGTIATDSTTVLGTSPSTYPTIASIEVTTSGNTITAKGYSSAGQVTQLGSTVTRNPSSPTTGSSIGIIKAPSAQAQGSTVDNYSVSV